MPLPKVRQLDALVDYEPDDYESADYRTGTEGIMADYESSDYLPNDYYTESNKAPIRTLAPLR